MDSINTKREILSSSSNNLKAGECRFELHIKITLL